MSYDLALYDEHGEKCVLPEKHHERQGTYQVGGTPTASMNITCNYADFFYKVFGEKGLRTLYGKTGEQSVPVLQEAIEALGVAPPTQRYWDATTGNARHALESCLKLARLCPQGTWDGD